MEVLLSPQSLSSRWPELPWGRGVALRLRDLLQLLLGVGAALSAEVPVATAKAESTNGTAAKLATSEQPAEVWGRICLAATCKLLPLQYLQ